MKAVKFFAALGVAVSLFAAGLGIVNASEEPKSCTHSYIVETTSKLREWDGQCDIDKNCTIHYTDYIRVQVCGSCGKYMGNHRWSVPKHGMKH